MFMARRLLGTWSLAVLAGFLGLMIVLASSPIVQAQDDLKDAAAAAAAPAEPAPAAAAEPAAATGEPAATTTPAASADTGKRESVLTFYFRALGIKYVIVFLALSFVLVAVSVLNILALRRDSIIPPALVEGFEANLNEKKYQEAYELAKADDSMLGRVLAAGLGKLSAGYAQAIEAMQEVSEDESMKLDHRLSYVALIGTLAPMFGLLGTVDGMVASFQVIASSTTQPKPSELAEGISMALITTLVGLWLAIPAIALFGLLRNRMARFVLEVGILSEGLMGRFGKKA